MVGMRNGEVTLEDTVAVLSIYRNELEVYVHKTSLHDADGSINHICQKNLRINQDVLQQGLEQHSGHWNVTQ
jgi:hypothetical protein